MPQETIGQRLKRVAQDKRGWSLRQLADELDVSYETLRKWVIGTTAPNRQRTAEVAKLLDVSVEFVTYGGAEPSSGEDMVPAVEITESEWAHLENLRLAPPSEKERLKQEAAAMSEIAREMRREILASLGMSGDADAASVAKALRPAPRHAIADKEAVVRVAVVPDPAPRPTVEASGPPHSAAPRPRSRYVATDKPSGHPQAEPSIRHSNPRKK